MTRRSFISKLVAAAGLVGIAPAGSLIRPTPILPLPDYLVVESGRYIEDVLMKSPFKESPWLKLMEGDLKYPQGMDLTTR